MLCANSVDGKRLTFEVAGGERVQILHSGASIWITLELGSIQGAPVEVGNHLFS